MHITAVLDLKAAYDSVPRKSIHEVVRTSQCDQVMDMVFFALQPITVTTQGDKTRKTGTIAKGVCQGKPLSPTHFNMYMDTMSIWLRRKGRRCARTRELTTQPWQMTIFADDVKIQTKDENMMQHLLTGTIEPAEEHRMTRNAKKCTILRKEGNTHARLLVTNGQ